MIITIIKRIVSEVWTKQNMSPGTRSSHGPGRSGDAVPRALRFDGKNHLPHGFDGYRDRHRCALCKAQTNLICMKCEVFLCCQFKRNCFIPWHTEDKGKLVQTPIYLVDNEADSELDNPDDDLQDAQSVLSDHDTDLQDTQSVHSNHDIDLQDKQSVHSNHDIDLQDAQNVPSSLDSDQ